MRKLVLQLMEVPVLRNAWNATLSFVREMRPGPRYPSDRERLALAAMHRDGIKRELASRAAASREQEDSQQLAYRRLWRSIRPAARDANPPQKLNPSVPDHITFALSVVGDFDAAREQPGEFADCLYRPVSDLPYPPAAIRECCEFLIAIADSGPGKLEGDEALIANERDTLGFALFSLDYFLDLPSSEMPRQTLQNLAYVKDEYMAGSKPPATPQPGDIVMFSGTGVADCVNQVIGVGANEEWMILTNSGVPIQVVYNTGLLRWEEVKVIAPASAAWLSSTPPAGVQSWESNQRRVSI